MTRKNLRLLAYGRVSDVRGREGPGFISPLEQTDRVCAYARALGHKIVDEGMELDRSGGDRSRPILEGLLQRIEAGEADGIIVAKLDRLARDNKGAWDTLERLKNAHGELLCVDPNIDTSTATGRLVRDILLVTANWERERIGEQWLRAKERAVGRGIHVSRHVPPGYKRLRRSNDPAKDRRLVPHAKHAATMAEAFAMATHGETYTRIAKFLTDRRLPIGGHAESVWEPYRIKRLLANRVYLGEARSGRGIVNAHAHDPLVDEETFLRAQRSNPAPEVTRDVDNLLAGLVRCASCSYAMRHQRGRKGNIAVYRCRTTSVNGRCPRPMTISQERLEAFVLERFLERHNRPIVATDDEPEVSLFAQEAIEAERSYREALTNVELRSQIGAADHDVMVGKLHEAWQAALERVPTPTRRPTMETADLAKLVAELVEHDEVLDLREILAADVQAVFVRPAVDRSHSRAIDERVQIVWHDDPPLELPKRGTRFESRSFT